ncbi:GTP cyclohydrolase II [Roseicitreum antarcticum]|uniref:GTP cyclohydrolase-2 n=1 Tax=Roseicitreum antarcticum TaxID=564137 RepID=A0A1H2TGY3_9RHOB|nr:GTP cyclohydrolase II [Roseicitreum antarcticum]SDW43223.1 GTP cyclohydrolase II [Roseicitreum antarcticum]
MNQLKPAFGLDSPLVSAIAPRSIELVMRARGDVRLGVPVILSHQGKCVLMIAAETLTLDRFNALAADQQPVQLLLTRHRVAALDVNLGPNDSLASKVVAISVPQGAGLDWVMSMADPAYPRATGHTADCAQPSDLMHDAAIALAKSAQLLPAALTVPIADARSFAQANALCMIDAADVLAELSAERLQAPVSSAVLPMAVHEAGRVHVFRPNDGGVEHYAIEIGNPDLSKPVLTRLHSACFTGDVMGSLKCDCGAQLQATCATMAAERGGLLLYLSQEGRGIGMANKMRAYALQDQGLDTVEANNHLGFNDDERDFRNGAAILKQLGISTVRLLTNNPAKMAILKAQGIAVTERVPLQVGKTAQNTRYLATKAAKSGHLLT